ncbi:uncharacterized protein VTP21DRAFT_2088 [Calcarisporiella thermophila]|uniref:uncharacterized protein n=1 Tax=Calcarisporiella thermophila TaxID=911321 RepID=UPI0037435A09
MNRTHYCTCKLKCAFGSRIGQWVDIDTFTLHQREERRLLAVLTAHGKSNFEDEKENDATQLSGDSESIAASENTVTGQLNSVEIKASVDRNSLNNNINGARAKGDNPVGAARVGYTANSLYISEAIATDEENHSSYSGGQPSDRYASNALFCNSENDKNIHWRSESFGNLFTDLFRRIKSLEVSRGILEKNFGVLQDSYAKLNAQHQRLQEQHHQLLMAFQNIKCQLSVEKHNLLDRVGGGAGCTRGEPAPLSDSQIFQGESRAPKRKRLEVSNDERLLLASTLHEIYRSIITENPEEDFDFGAKFYSANNLPIIKKITSRVSTKAEAAGFTFDDSDICDSLSKYYEHLKREKKDPPEKRAWLQQRRRRTNRRHSKRTRRQKTLLKRACDFAKAHGLTYRVENFEQLIELDRVLNERRLRDPLLARDYSAYIPLFDNVELMSPEISDEEEWCEEGIKTLSSETVAMQASIQEVQPKVKVKKRLVIGRSKEVSQFFRFLDSLARENTVKELITHPVDPHHVHLTEGFPDWAYSSWLQQREE